MAIAASRDVEHEQHGKIEELVDALEKRSARPLGLLSVRMWDIFAAHKVRLAKIRKIR